MSYDSERRSVISELVHLYQSSCWVSSLLKVFLSVLLLNLQSKTRTQDPLKDRQTDRQVSCVEPGGGSPVSGKLR